jgi:hypothetical protein
MSEESGLRWRQMMPIKWNNNQQQNGEKKKRNIYIRLNQLLLVFHTELLCYGYMGLNNTIRFFKLSGRLNTIWLVSE